MTPVDARPGFDPRSKLVLVLAISTVAIASGDPAILAPLALLAALAARSFGAGVLAALARLRRLLWVLVAMGVIQSAFAGGGRVLVSLGGISLLTSLGVERGAAIILRILVIVVSASIMTTSNPRDIIQGLHQWRIPYELAFMVALAIRFLPLLREEAEDTLVALQLRGVRLEEMSLTQKFGVFRHLLTPLIAGVLARAERMSISVELRGFRAYPRRTSHRLLVLAGRDYLLMLSGLLVAAGGLATLYWR